MLFVDVLLGRYTKLHQKKQCAGWYSNPEHEQQKSTQKQCDCFQLTKFRMLELDKHGINMKKVGQYVAELKRDKFTTNDMAVSKT